MFGAWGGGTESVAHWKWEASIRFPPRDSVSLAMDFQGEKVA